MNRIPDHVHRSYKDNNRWMYVAPVRDRITIWSILEGVLIGVAMAVAMIAVCVVVLLPLIG